MAEEIGPGEAENKDPTVRWLEATVGTVAALLLFGMMTITVVDVFGRYLFNAPLASGYELIQIGMAVLVFVTLPILTARDEQVRIDIFIHIFPRSVRPWLRLVSEVICLVILVAFAWFLWQRAASFVSAQETTSTLRFPLAPLAFFVAAAWLVAAAIVAVRLVRFRRVAAERATP